MRLLSTILAAAWLFGCAGAVKETVKKEIYDEHGNLLGVEETVDWNPQQYSGLSVWRIDYDKDGKIKDVSVIDGKAKQNVRLNITKHQDQSITFSYSATGIQAFEGQAIRADVESGIVDATKEVSGEILKTIIEAVKPLP